jgi:peptidoglycan/LPS O-acetylase OafA/YrhL
VPARWPIIFVATGLAALGYLVALGATGGIRPLAVPRWPALTLLCVNLLGFGIVGLVLCRQGAPALALLRRPRLVRIGKASYGLYMYHYVILCLSDDAAHGLGLGGRPLWREGLTMALILGVAAVSWRYFECPILALKDRFPYRPRALEQTAAPHGPKSISSTVAALRPQGRDPGQTMTASPDLR